MKYYNLFLRFFICDVYPLQLLINNPVFYYIIIYYIIIYYIIIINVGLTDGDAPGVNFQLSLPPRIGVSLIWADREAGVDALPGKLTLRCNRQSRFPWAGEFLS